MLVYSNGVQLTTRQIREGVQGVSIEAMPEQSRNWFDPDYIVPEGLFWDHDAVNNWPVLVEMPAESVDQQRQAELMWRDKELGLADRCYTRKFGPVGWLPEQRAAAQDKIDRHIDLLKLWPDHPEFPNSDHRPVWPEGVPRPVS